MPYPEAGVSVAIQQVLDKQAISEAIMRYCRGIDRCDPDLIGSAYHPDAVDDHGGQRFVGESIGSGLADLVRGWKTSAHHVTNQLITLHGDGTAGCESYYTAWQRLDLAGEERLLLALGRYVDRFECRAGEWRIARRLVIVELTQVVPADGVLPPSRPGLGSRDRDDPSYALLGPTPTN